MEKWKAVKVEAGIIDFDVEGKDGEHRTEQRFVEALPLMFEQGGYPAIMGVVLMMQPESIEFTKHENGQIYLKEKNEL